MFYWRVFHNFRAKDMMLLALNDGEVIGRANSIGVQGFDDLGVKVLFPTGARDFPLSHRATWT
jgi:hypothetical protein